MPRRRTTNFSRGVKRPVEWLRGLTAMVEVVGAAGVNVGSAFNISGAFPAFAAATSPTIVRIRGTLNVGGRASVGPFIPFSAGFVQMSAKAFSVGLTAIPFPGVNDADWQWYYSGAVGDSVASDEVPEEDVLHIEIDSKAMRKYEQDDQIMVFVITNHSAAIGEDLVFQMAFSILLKE